MHDFSLPIVVMPPEPSPDDHARTRPFTRAGVIEPLAAPRHAWLPSHSGQPPSPSRQKARSLLGVPPPPPVRASPLNEDEEARRIERRVRARQRIAWAQALLRRFQFEP
jgi:hypothetical protein